MYKAVPVKSAPVSIWVAQLTCLQWHYDRFFQVLTEEERQRAMAFYFEKDRWRFVLSRGMLRELLGQYLGQPPDQLQLTTNMYGKPRLVSQTGTTSIQFNLSHSEGVVTVILSDYAVGIDVEYIHRDLDTDALVRHYFSAIEVDAYFQISQQFRKHFFYRLWTRKEAFLKATGDGLNIPLKNFSVLGVPFTPIKITDQNSMVPYEIVDFEPNVEPYMSCFCVEKSN